MARITVELVDELKTAPRYSPSTWDAMHDDGDGGRHCNICDGVGHGYPGGGPCPLENTMSQADVDREDDEYRTELWLRGKDEEEADRHCDSFAEGHYYNGYPNARRDFFKGE